MVLCWKMVPKGPILSMDTKRSKVGKGYLNFHCWQSVPKGSELARVPKGPRLAKGT